MNASRILKIALTASRVSPESMEDPDKVEWQVNKRDIFFAEVFASILGLPYEIVPALEYGRRLPDGNWTGVMSEVMNGFADITPLLYPTEERIAAVQFGYPFLFDKVSFITHKAEVLPKTLAFVQPFTREVWFAMLLTLLTMSIVLKFVLGGKHKYCKVLFALLQSILKQSWSIKSVGNINKLLHATWLLNTMLIGSFYAAVLLSFLTIPSRRSIRNISELANAVIRGSHHCKGFPGSFFGKSLASSKDDSFRLIGESMIKNQGPETDTIEILTQKGAVFVGGTAIQQGLRDHYFISEDSFFFYFCAPAYSKDFCCSQKLDTAIFRAAAAGLFEKAMRDTSFFTFYTQLSKTKEEEIEKELSLSDLSGAFALLILGHVVAFLVLLLEIATFLK